MAAALATLLISVLPFVDFAYRSRPVHVANRDRGHEPPRRVPLLGRFRRSGSLRDLLLFGALALLAAMNLWFSSIPALFGGPPGGSRPGPR